MTKLNGPEETTIRGKFQCVYSISLPRCRQPRNAESPQSVINGVDMPFQLSCAGSCCFL